MVRRAASAGGPVRLAGALAVVVLALGVTSGAHAAHPGCSGQVSAANNDAVTLTAFDLRPSHLRCSGARSIVRAYLRKKINDRSETCAGRAENPPFRGCRVDHYRCRATSATRRPTPQLCTDGRRAVRFSERDTDDG